MSAKELRKEDWIQITQPGGKKMIASPNFIRELLGISKDKMNLFNRLHILECKVDHLESPGRQEEILKLLRENGKHNRAWISNRVGNYQWYDLDVLKMKGLIKTSKAGSVTMYSCAELKKT